MQHSFMAWVLQHQRMSCRFLEGWVMQALLAEGLMQHLELVDVLQQAMETSIYAFSLATRQTTFPTYCGPQKLSVSLIKGMEWGSSSCQQLMKPGTNHLRTVSTIF